MAKIINGTAKADNLTVKESNVIVNAGKGNDIITIAKGKKNIIHGNKGNDTIYINGGSSNSIYGDEGNDTFVVSKKSKAVIKDYTAGKDTLRVSGTITGTSRKNKNLVINVGKGAVTLEDTSGKVISVKDSRGSYTISKTAISLGKTFKGTMNANNFLPTVKTIDARKTIKAVNITGNAGSNTIYAGKASGNINGGAGNDKIIVSSGKKHTLRGGTGKDTYAIKTALARNTRLTINQKDYTLKDKNKDILQLSKVNINDVDFSLKNGTLTVTHKSGGTVTVSGWSKNPFSRIQFADKKYMTASAINEYLAFGNVINVDQSGTYTATARKDIFRFSGKGWDAIIAGATGEDVIDVSNYNDDVYEMGSFYRENDDFKATFKTSWDSEIIGSLTIRNYFAAEDRINNLKWYHHFTSWFEGEESGEIEELNVVVSDDKENADINGTDGNDLIITGNGDKTVFAGAGNDKIHVGWKDEFNYIKSFGNQIINAGPGNDTIWVEYFEDGGVHELNGGEGDDLIYTWENNNVLNGDDGEDYLQADGTGHKLYGGEDDDRLHAGGSGNELYGENGNDDVEVNGDSNVLNGGDGNDNLYGGGNANTLDGADGNDKIEVYVFDREKFTSSDNNIINGGRGDDSIRVGGYRFGDYYEGNFNSISGGPGEDSIYVRGNNNTVNGDADDDELDVAGNSNIVNGGAGNDTINIGSDDNTVDGGNGEDRIDITGNENTAYGGDHIDYLTSYDGDNNLLLGEGGDDRLYIQGGQGNVLIGGDDDDMMWISEGTNNTLYGDSGNDILSVDGGNGHTLVGGPGADCYSYNLEIAADTRLTIRQGEHDDGYADTMMLLNVNKEDVEYSLEGGTLTITHSSGGTITVENWDKNPISDIEYGEKHDGYTECIRVTCEEINEALNKKADPGPSAPSDENNTIPGVESGNIIQVNASREYEGTADKDIFVASGSDWNAVISGIGPDDILNLNCYEMYDPRWRNGSFTIDAWGFPENSVQSEGGKITFSDSAEGKLTMLVRMDTATTQFQPFQQKRLIASLEDTVNGSEEDDIIVVSPRDGLTINMDSGDDQIYMEGVQNNSSIYGGDGRDDIAILNGNYNTIYGGAGNDHINTWGNQSENNFIYGDDGNDYIWVWDDRNVTVDGGSGDDFILITPGDEIFQGTFSGGKGSDVYEIREFGQGGLVTIDQGDYSDGDADVLEITGYNQGDMVYTFRDDTLSISVAEGSTISVTNWSTNPLEKVVFAETNEMTCKDINDRIGLG